MDKFNKRFADKNPKVPSVQRIIDSTDTLRKVLHELADTQEFYPPSPFGTARRDTQKDEQFWSRMGPAGVAAALVQDISAAGVKIPKFLQDHVIRDIGILAGLVGILQMTRPAFRYAFLNNNTTFKRLLNEPIIFEVIKGKNSGSTVSLGTLLDLITVDGVVDIEKMLKNKGVYNARITDASAQIIHEAATLTNKVDKETYRNLFAAAALAYKPLSDYVLSRSKLQDPSDPQNRILPQDVINQKVRLFKEQMGYKSSKPGDK